jgi:hypothetical protein
MQKIWDSHWTHYRYWWFQFCLRDSSGHGRHQAISVYLPTESAVKIVTSHAVLVFRFSPVLLVYINFIVHLLVEFIFLSIRYGKWHSQGTSATQYLGYNWATQPQGYVNSGDWPSRLGVGLRPVTLPWKTHLAMKSQTSLRKSKPTNGCSANGRSKRTHIFKFWNNLVNIFREWKWDKYSLVC